MSDIMSFNLCSDFHFCTPHVLAGCSEHSSDPFVLVKGKHFFNNWSVLSFEEFFFAWTFLSSLEIYNWFEKLTLLKGIKVERQQRMTIYIAIHGFKYTALFTLVFEKLCIDGC
jgi:hypothetical protein